MLKPFYNKKKNIDNRLLPSVTAADAGKLVGVTDEGKFGLVEGGGGGEYDLFVKITATASPHPDYPTQLVFSAVTLSTDWDTIKDAIQSQKYIGGVIDMIINGVYHEYAPLVNIADNETYYGFEYLKIVNSGTKINVRNGYANLSKSDGSLINGDFEVGYYIDYNT